MITFSCTCGENLRAPDNAAGGPITCPHCKQVCTVPKSDAAIDVPLPSGALRLAIGQVLGVLLLIALMPVIVFATEVGPHIPLVITIGLSGLGLALSLRLLAAGLKSAFAGKAWEGTFAAVIGHFGLWVFYMTLGCALFGFAAVMAGERALSAQRQGRQPPSWPWGR